jgi:hypothetical protein
MILTPGSIFVVARTNRWPVEDCPIVFAATDVYETAGTVASSRAGAVVVHDDGTIEGAASISSPNGSGSTIVPMWGGWVSVPDGFASAIRVRESGVSTPRLFGTRRRRAPFPTCWHRSSGSSRCVSGR